MQVNVCQACYGLGRVSAGRWWQVWRWFRTVGCDVCGGDGRAHPPGWPDPAEMARWLPRPSPPPPPKKPDPPTIVVIREGGTQARRCR